MSLLSTKIASFVALVMCLGSGLTLLKTLNKGMNFSLGKGRRWCLRVLGVCGGRPLTHTLVFLVPSFGKVTDVGIDKSFAAEVGGSCSNFMNLTFLSSSSRVAFMVMREWQYISSPLVRRKVERILDHSWWSQMPSVARAWQS